METSKAIKNFQGIILGYIWTDKESGRERATDFYGKILGFYDPKLDLTKEFSGRIITKGNVLAYFITDNYNKTK